MVRSIDAANIDQILVYRVKPHTFLILFYLNFKNSDSQIHSKTSATAPKQNPYEELRSVVFTNENFLSSI